MQYGQGRGSDSGENTPVLPLHRSRAWGKFFPLPELQCHELCNINHSITPAREEE